MFLSLLECSLSSLSVFFNIEDFSVTSNFQNPTNITFDIYFNTMKNIFSSLRKISSKKTKILQLVAFNNKDGVFKKYLKKMEECGFKELKIN